MELIPALNRYGFSDGQSRQPGLKPQTAGAILTGRARSEDSRAADNSAIELQELQDRSGLEWQRPCWSGSLRRAVGLREVCYRVKAPAVGPG